MSNPPLADLTKNPHPALSEPPILSSGLSEWQGVFFNHYHHPAYESPEFQYTQHIIGITGNKHPMRSEHRFDGGVQTHYCQPGEVLFIPARVSYSSNWEKAGNFSLIGFFPNFFEQITNESVRVKQIELIPQIGLNDSFIRQIGIALKADVEAGYPAGKIFGESLATALVIHLIKHYSAWQVKLPSESAGSLSKYQLQTIQDYISAHLNQNISLSELAGIINLSQYHFSRLFKQSTGITPHQYLTRCRIDKAKQLLSNTELTITDITFEIGFTNHSSFTRLFRKYVGVTPSSFRASQ
jgi:AraC family transcriptional regulator